MNETQRTNFRIFREAMRGKSLDEVRRAILAIKLGPVVGPALSMTGVLRGFERGGYVGYTPKGPRAVLMQPGLIDLGRG